METEIRPESRRYASDKPVSCKYCYFWGGRKKGCELKECYYLLRKKNRKKQQRNPPVADVHTEKSRRALVIAW